MGLIALFSFPTWFWSKLVGQRHQRTFSPNSVLYLGLSQNFPLWLLIAISMVFHHFPPFSTIFHQFFWLSKSSVRFCDGQFGVKDLGSTTGSFFYLRPHGAQGISGIFRKPIEPLKIPWLIDCYRGLYYLVYWGL